MFLLGQILTENKKKREVLTYLMNTSIRHQNFPSCLKYANITPVFKKGGALDPINNKPMSITPVFVKVFERSKQIFDY